MGVRRVVIDPGHGGHDPGARGAGGLLEKDIALDVALRLRATLQEEHGLEVIMTRDCDVFIPLEERTAIANTNRADLFISVHCNASRKKSLRGVETFFLNLASSRSAAETAARENMTSVATIADFEKTMVDMFMSMKLDESGRFARIAHEELHGKLRKGYKDTVDLGVRQAPFVVLIGAQMPSILSEISFIDHKVEGKRLASEAYRQQVAEALAAGISRYVGTVRLAAAR
jgi:N-acetylmuramoyl-L-alanine amidase